MAGVDFVFNIAKGRVAEYYNRVQSGDPAASTLIVVVLRVAGLEPDSVLQDYATLAAVLAGSTDEATNVNYARKSIAAGNLTALSADNVLDQMVCDTPDQTWTAVTAGDDWAKVLICYKPSGAADSAVIPLTAHSFDVSPTGTDITVAINNFFRATAG